MSARVVLRFFVVGVALQILLMTDEYGRNGQKECMVFARVGVLEVFQVFVLLATERSQRNQSLWVVAFESFVTNELNLACL